MLFDATFRERVYANPGVALHDVDLTAEERGWLVVPDARAYSTDQYRQSRALTGLLEEYPVTGAVAMRSAQGAQRLHAFFASEVFHLCIQQRGSMAAAFGSYLASPTFADCPDLAPLAQVEQSIARVRRAVYVPTAAGQPCTGETCLRLAPWVALVSVPAPTLKRYNRLYTHLQQHHGTVLEAVLHLAYRLPKGPSLRRQPPTFVLVVGLPGTDNPSLETVSHELGTVLEAARKGMVCHDLCTVAVRLGPEPHEALEIVQECVTDQLLVPV
jgi:hypothetical protein